MSSSDSGKEDTSPDKNSVDMDMEREEEKHVQTLTEYVLNHMPDIRKNKTEIGSQIVTFLLNSELFSSLEQLVVYGPLYADLNLEKFETRLEVPKNLAPHLLVFFKMVQKAQSKPKSKGSASSPFISDIDSSLGKEILSEAVNYIKVGYGCRAPSKKEFDAVKVCSSHRGFCEYLIKNMGWTHYRFGNLLSWLNDVEKYGYGPDRIQPV